VKHGPIVADLLLAVNALVAHLGWSRRRIVSELAKLGHSIDKDTAAKYMLRPTRQPRRPPLKWKTFPHNYLAGTIGIDFLTVPTGLTGKRRRFSQRQLARAGALLERKKETG
jgi:hypothetical protein